MADTDGDPEASRLLSSAQGYGATGTKPNLKALSEAPVDDEDIVSHRHGEACKPDALMIRFCANQPT